MQWYVYAVSEVLRLILVTDAQPMPNAKRRRMFGDQNCYTPDQIHAAIDNL